MQNQMQTQLYTSAQLQTQLCELNTKVGTSTIVLKARQENTVLKSTRSTSKVRHKQTFRGCSADTDDSDNNVGDINTSDGGVESDGDDSHYGRDKKKRKNSGCKLPPFTGK